MAAEKAETAKCILRICHDLTEKGLVNRAWGNVSARLSEDTFLITPSGSKYEDMTEEDLVEVRISDLSWSGERKPSSEKGIHAEIYQLRPGCGFIIHTHQKFASAISVAGKDLQLTYYRDIPEKHIRTLGPVVPCAEYGVSTTAKLAKGVAAAAKGQPECRALLIQCHGAVCMGRDGAEALEAALDLEDVCRRGYERRCGESVLTEEGPQLVSESEGRYRIHIRTPYVMEMSRRGRTVYPYLDDVAKIAGPSVRCVRQDPTSAEIRKACRNRNAVLIKDDGAICMADTRDEAEDCAAILEKNCLAANLAIRNDLPPLGRISARLRRSEYKKRIAKLRDRTSDAGREKAAEEAETE